MDKEELEIFTDLAEDLAIEIMAEFSQEDRKDILGHLDDTTHGGHANASIETLRESLNKHSPSTLLAQCLELYGQGSEDK